MIHRLHRYLKSLTQDTLCLTVGSEGYIFKEVEN